MAAMTQQFGRQQEEHRQELARRDAVVDQIRMQMQGMQVRGGAQYFGISTPRASPPEAPSSPTRPAGRAGEDDTDVGSRPPSGRPVLHDVVRA
jgi:hypothetical protein